VGIEQSLQKLCEQQAKGQQQTMPRIETGDIKTRKEKNKQKININA
jgi:hypothetical protein